MSSIPNQPILSEGDIITLKCSFKLWGPRTCQYSFRMNGRRLPYCNPATETINDTTTYIAKMIIFGGMNERELVCRLELDFLLKTYSNKLIFKINGTSSGKNIIFNIFIKKLFNLFFLGDNLNGSAANLFQQIQQITQLLIVASFFSYIYL